MPDVALNLNNHSATATHGDTAAVMTPKGLGAWVLSGTWTASGLGTVQRQLQTLASTAGPQVLDGAGIDQFDSAGAWMLQAWLQRNKATADLHNWQPRWQSLMAAAADHANTPVPSLPREGHLASLGRSVMAGAKQAMALLVFLGETALVAGRVFTHPRLLRWRTVLHHVQIGGFDALPIVGLMSFLLGVVVAYQGADQLRHYGANIFVVDLVGYAMLREFAPLMTAIIIAGRSGSSYAAQIGTMVVTEEIDAMRTIGIDPSELLVLPRILALVIALPLLTVLADITGVFGGMVMASTQLDIGWYEFMDRFSREMKGSHLLVGLGKSLVFAVVIAVIGCFQGFRTHGSADSVGRQTTLSVVQAIFLVIVTDAVFSVAFNILGL